MLAVVDATRGSDLLERLARDGDTTVAGKRADEAAAAGRAEDRATADNSRRDVAELFVGDGLRRLSRGLDLIEEDHRSTAEVARFCADLLAIAGYLRKAPRRLTTHVDQIVERHGRAAPRLLVMLLADVARDPKVRSIGAVLTKRLPRLLSNEPDSAFGANAPRTLEEAVARLAPPPESTVSTKKTRQALDLYRAGVEIEAIGDRLDLRREDVRRAIAAALARSA